MSNSEKSISDVNQPEDSPFGPIDLDRPSSDPTPSPDVRDNDRRVASFPSLEELNVHERAEIRSSLVSSFNLSELQDLSFDLGIDIEDLSYQNKNDLARVVVSYCERRGLVGNLVTQMIQSRGVLKDKFAPLLATIPANPRKKVQLILPGDFHRDQDKVRTVLSHLLGIQPEEIGIIAAAYGSIYYLLSLPFEAAEKLAEILRSHPDKLRESGIDVQFFEELTEAEQDRWREIAIMHVPQIEENRIVPTATWAS